MNLPNLNLFQKNFISVVITPTRILVTKLNNNKTKVEVVAQKNIAPGVIMSYRVMESKVLVETIQSLWKENKIHDKFVGVVVPEFATYTKTLELPNLSDSEINEALGWQMEEYLPAPIDEMVVDWKIIKREKEKVVVLVVAIIKEMLMGYIDVIGSAGLSPLVVETPSLSISRITAVDDQPKLIIYLNGPEALIVISQGHNILASSVVSSTSINIIVSTALQIISHYNNIQIEHVYVGGVGISQDLISNLHYNLGRTVQLLDYKVGNLAPPQTQDYLLGISLQHKDPVEPASELTINLLPSEWADTYRKQLTIFKGWTLTLIVSIITWSSFLAAFLVMMVISLQVDSYSRHADSDSLLEYNQAVASVNQANALAKKIVDIDNQITPYQEVINHIYSFKNDGITISSISINMENGSMKILGNAIQPQSLITFHDDLEADEDIAAIDFPFTNLLEQTNITFEFETAYVPLTQPSKRSNIKLSL